jgi:hypothetical protein
MYMYIIVIMATYIFHPYTRRVSYMNQMVYFFYVSAFHILMNIFTFRHYRQNEQLYLSLLTAIP